MTSSKKIFIYLTPRASRNKIEGTLEKDSKLYIRAWVTSLPKDGEANDSLILFLSKTWHIPKSHIQLIAGHQSRYKTLLVQDLEDKIVLPQKQKALDL
jgi:uncharacterized protein (TIGR00251 family)